MSKFNEATRVQMPAMVHLTRLGYSYVIPTEFITAKSGIENKILKHIVDNKIVYGCVSMPSNVFANTGTNVSVLFFDDSKKSDKVVLIDASKLGEEYKDSNGLKKVRLRDEEIDQIVSTFQNKEAVDTIIDRKSVV